ncbi:MAG: hypothetical protein DRO12_00350 [Thermoprotei archaeon]|nr:MAG: hypothetical protein DRO12_00350 [Thermoprotei archaeon]
MEFTVDVVVKYLGQPLRDIYGRNIGVVTSIYSDVDGVVNSVEVMTNELIHETIPAKRFDLTSDGLRLLPEWLVEAKEIEKRLDTVRKRLAAVEELYRKGQIPSHAYEEVKGRLSEEMDKLRKRAREAKEKLRKRANDLENMIIHIEKAMTHLLVSYTAGEIPETPFRAAIDKLRFSKQCAQNEKKDVEKHIELIEKLELEAVKKLEVSIEEGEKESAKMPAVPEKAPSGSSSGPVVVKVVNA